MRSIIHNDDELFEYLENFPYEKMCAKIHGALYDGETGTHPNAQDFTDKFNKFIVGDLIEQLQKNEAITDDKKIEIMRDIFAVNEYCNINDTFVPRSKNKTSAQEKIRSFNLLCQHLQSSNADILSLGIGVGNNPYDIFPQWMNGSTKRIEHYALDMMQRNATDVFNGFLTTLKQDWEYIATPDVPTYTNNKNTVYIMYEIFFPIYLMLSKTPIAEYLYQKIKCILEAKITAGKEVVFDSCFAGSHIDPLVARLYNELREVKPGRIFLHSHGKMHPSTSTSAEGLAGNRRDWHDNWYGNRQPFDFKRYHTWVHTMLYGKPQGYGFDGLIPIDLLCQEIPEVTSATAQLREDGTPCFFVSESAPSFAEIFKQQEKLPTFFEKQRNIEAAKKDTASPDTKPTTPKP